MVVCNCRKATKLYCFVHKIPVCGKCICSPEHQICVVRTYSEWVIDGEYEWPPRCCKCLAELDEGSSLQTTQLGCLHIAHTNCLVSHIKSVPSHTAPAGYVCPSCSNSIWPPKSVKDSSSKLHSQLKEVIMLSGMEKNLFGNHSIPLPTAESRVPPPAFSADPLKNVSSSGRKEYGSSLLPSEEDNATSNGYLPAGGRPSKLTVTEIVEVDGPNSPGSYMKNSSPVATVATTRKSTAHYQRQDSEISYFADDEDGSLKKYSRRGSFRQKFLRSLLPFWSSALPTLPVSAPPCKDAKDVDDIQEGRLRHQRTSQMDPRKILLLIAIIACMATMGILYYKLAQRALTEDDEELVVAV